MELKSRAFLPHQAQDNTICAYMMMISDFYAFHSKNHPLLYASYNTQRKSKC